MLEFDIRPRRHADVFLKTPQPLIYPPVTPVRFLWSVSIIGLLLTCVCYL
jgi:hypothetical protein